MSATTSNQSYSPISRRKLRLMMLLPWLLACSSFVLPEPSAPPTPTSPALVELEFVVRTAPSPTATATFTVTPSPSPTPPQPSPTLTPSPSPTPTPIPPTATPPPPDTGSGAGAGGSSASPGTATGGSSANPGTTASGAVTPIPSSSSPGAVNGAVPSPVQGSIALLAPGDPAPIPSSQDYLEFKWRWYGDLRLERCQLIPGYGFEVRIWPAQTGYGPLGAMDAAQNGQDPAFSCDPATGIYTYLVTYLKQKPGVKPAGAGKFLWDVTLAQLGPYQPLIAAPPRLFEITYDYKGPLDPFGQPLGCNAFTYWAEAQAIFFIAGGPAKDPHNLDPDGDQRACNELFGN